MCIFVVVFVPIRDVRFWLNSNWVTILLTHTHNGHVAAITDKAHAFTQTHSCTLFLPLLLIFNVIVSWKRIFEPQIVQHNAYKHLNTFTISEVHQKRVLSQGLYCVAIATSFVEHNAHTNIICARKMNTQHLNAMIIYEFDRLSNNSNSGKYFIFSIFRRVSIQLQTVYNATSFS